MRICDNCGAEFDDRDEFCPECGAPVEEEPFDEENDEFYEEPEEHLKICPQCGEYVSLDSNICPSCQYIFYKKNKTKLYAMIGGGVVLVAAIVVAVILLIGHKQPIEIVTQPTIEPVPVVTQAPAVDVTNTPTVEPAATQASSSENDVLASRRDEALTVFELLEPAAAGEAAVTVYSVDSKMKSVSVSTAESYITKLLSLSFGDKVGFEYNFYRSDDGSWRLIMSGTLKDEQLTKMLALEDDNIYATFRSMYLNSARQVIYKATGSQPVITLSVYKRGKSGDEYSLRVVETEPGNGTVSRAE